MKKTEIKHPDKQVSTGAYSAGIVLDGWLYISGHASEDLKTGEIILGGIEAQTRITLTHIGKVLEAAGASFDDVVKCTCHLADIREFDGFNAAYREFFQPPLPARTTVQSGLPDGIKVEIDAVACLRKGGAQA